MKNYILLFLLAIASCGISQTKKSAKKQKIIYRDSVYYSFEKDTLWGIVEYDAGYSGKVRGDGILVKSVTYQWHTTVPQRPPQYIIVKGDTVAWGGGGDLGMENYKSNFAYIKTKDGYKRVDEKFVFSPYVKPKDQ